MGGSAAATALGIGLGIAFLPVPNSTEAVLAVSFSFKKSFPLIFWTSRLTHLSLSPISQKPYGRCTFPL